MTLDADVEIVKLARLVGVEPEELGYLRDVDGRTSATCASR